MCTFFSFISYIDESGKHQRKYFNSKDRKNNPKLKHDSHTEILKYFSIKDEKFNAYEYTNDELKHDLIQNNELVSDDTKALNKFIVSKAFEDICLEAVKNNGLNLEYVKNQTKELCLEAVKQNGYALYFVNTKFKYLFNK